MRRTGCSDPSKCCCQCRPLNRRSELVEQFNRNACFREGLGACEYCTVRFQPCIDLILAFFLIQWQKHGLHTAGNAGIAHFLDYGVLFVRELQSTQGARCGFRIGKSSGQGARASADRRGRIVQLVRQSGGEFAERYHFLVVEKAGRKVSRPIDHEMNERGCYVAALTDHFREIVAMNGDQFRGFLGDDVSRRCNQTRIRQQSRDVSAAPLHDLVAPCSTIHVDGKMAVENDVQTFNLSVLCSEDGACFELPQGAVRRDPCDLFGRCGTPAFDVW
jgi:hypothetical protein